MFTFTFTKKELFKALAPYKGNTRTSIIGMFNSCQDVNTALSIAYFLKKNRLGGLNVSACPNSLKVNIYLNPKIEVPIELPKVNKQKVLMYI